MKKQYYSSLFIEIEKQLLILILLMETQVTKFSSLPTQSKLPPIKLKIMNVMKQYGK